MLKRILVDLDTLLDTRLGVINMLNPKAAEHIIKNDDYWDRENDFWELLTNGLVTREEFNEGWAARGGNNSATVLNGSVISGIQPFIMRVITEDLVNRANQMGDELDQLCLVINTWPYALSLDEIEDMRDIAIYLFGATTPTEVVCIPLDKITPGFLDKDYAAMITYSFIEWIKIHFADLAKARMNCFNFISPRIFEQDVSKLSVDEKKTIIDVFRIEKLIHMDFEFIDARYFSMFRPNASSSAETESSP